MNRLVKVLAGIAMLATAVAVCAPAPDASNSHFIITNNHTDTNTGTVLKLAGTAKNPVLNRVAPLYTHVPDDLGGQVPDVQIVKSGQDVCAFLANGTYDTSNEISAFKYPSITLVRNYSNPETNNSIAAIAASGGYLYADYGDVMGIWAIGSSCILHLLQTSQINNPDSAPVEGMAVTPDGKTLVLSEVLPNTPDDSCCVDSFSIGSHGALTEHGPYHVHAAGPWGLDITADSQFAIFGIKQNYIHDSTSLVMVLPINSDGSLGTEYDFSNVGNLESGPRYVRLSPNEKYLYATGLTGNQSQVVTLDFSENPLNITYSGCTTTLKDAGNSAESLASVTTTGTGGGLYVAEIYRVGLLTVDPATGCTTEAPSSPFAVPADGMSSLAAWPPRPF